MGKGTETGASAWRDEFRTTLNDGRLIRTARIPKRAPRSAAAILRRAASIVERKGLANGVMRDANGCRCLYAALLEASGLGYDLDSAIDVGHIDARQVDGMSAYGRFENFRDALDLLGQPQAWGNVRFIAPLARFSDASDVRTVTRLLRSAAAGNRPTWTTKVIDGAEMATLAR